MAKANSLGISKTYLRHFVKNIDSRYVFCIGGRRSGKSVNTAKWIRFIASAKKTNVMIVTATFPALQLCIQDWELATGLTVSGSMVYGYNCTLRNGSVIQFRSFDTPQKCQGSGAGVSIIWIEEFLNVAEEVIRVLTMSCTGQLYFTANPTRRSKLLDDYVDKDGGNLLKTTYKDNQYLTPEQVKEFDDMKLRAQQPNATMYDIFCAKVYCDGDFSDMVGRVFDRLEYCSYPEYQDIPAEEAIAMDLGFGGADSTAIVGCKMYKNKLYCHCYHYGRGTLKAEHLAVTLFECGFNPYTAIIADYGGVGRQILNEVISGGPVENPWEDYRICNGFSIVNAIKRPVLEDLQGMMGLDAIVLDNSSDAMRMEFENLQLGEDKKVIGKDHAVDAVRYAYEWLKKCGY